MASLRRIPFLVFTSLCVLSACGEPSSEPRSYAQISERLDFRLLEQSSQKMEAEPNSEEICFILQLRFELRDRMSAKNFRYHSFELKALQPEVSLPKPNVQSNSRAELNVPAKYCLGRFESLDPVPLDLTFESQELGFHHAKLLVDFSSRSEPILSSDFFLPKDKEIPRQQIVKERKFALSSESYEVELIRRGSAGRHEVEVEMRGKIVDARTGRALAALPIEIQSIDHYRQRHDQASLVTENGESESAGYFTYRFPLEYRAFENEIEQRVDILIRSPHPTYPASIRQSLILNLSRHNRPELSTVVGSWAFDDPSYPNFWRERAFRISSAEAQSIGLRNLEISALDSGELDFDSRLKPVQVYELQFAAQAFIERSGFESKQSFWQSLSSTEYELELSLLSNDPRRTADVLARSEWNGQTDSFGVLKGQVRWGVTQASLSPSERWILVRVLLPHIPSIPEQVFLLAPNQSQPIPLKWEELNIRTREQAILDPQLKMQLSTHALELSLDELRDWDLSRWSSTLSELALADLVLFGQLTEAASAQRLEIYSLYKEIEILEVVQQKPLYAGSRTWVQNKNSKFDFWTESREVQYRANAKACLLFRFERGEQIRILHVCQEELKEHFMTDQFVSISLPKEWQVEGGKQWRALHGSLPIFDSIESFKDWLDKSMELDFKNTSLQLIYENPEFRLQIR